ncbi:hypothetical protein L873DRAFT_197068 [Choiromyces venosus 120613-1]|uniref:Uncharacterized protein n=1 Tax=Choiromyces venosus 120613-1 TaxID=1336337 RepID=A0A3N4J234_9PEZI|nr:hypothetical protein L873DRAFT_197068 [Choiromyces venosus 120613-1]
MEDARDGRGSWRPSRPFPGTDGRALPVSQDMECAGFLPVTAGDCGALQLTAGPCSRRPGPTGDGRALQVTAGVCHLFYHIRRLQGPRVNPQDGRLYERWTPCPAVLIHPARDGWEHCYQGPQTMPLHSTGTVLRLSGCWPEECEHVVQ